MSTHMAMLFWRLMLSTLLGALVGLQREQSGRPAGLRTHTLVCVGAALITMVSETYPGDEARISAQIVSGIGFLGAGTIIREGHTVRGLTTAASLWAVAGLGIACGRGGDIMMLGVIATVIILATLGFGKHFEDRLMSAHARNTLCIRGGASAQATAVQALSDAGIKVLKASRRRTETGRAELALRLEMPIGMARERAIQMTINVEGITSAEWSSLEAEQNAV